MVLTRTVEVIVHEHPGGRRRFCRRRVQAARLWEQIESNNLERAAIRLCRGYSYICWGGRIKTSSWVETGISSRDSLFNLSDDSLDYLIRCKDEYLRWAAECDKNSLNRVAVMDILFFGKSAGEVEKFYHKRHGWAIKNLVAALKLHK